MSHIASLEKQSKKLSSVEVVEGLEILLGRETLYAQRSISHVDGSYIITYSPPQTQIDPEMVTQIAEGTKRYLMELGIVADLSAKDGTYTITIDSAKQNDMDTRLFDVVFQRQAVAHFTALSHRHVNFFQMDLSTGVVSPHLVIYSNEAYGDQLKEWGLAFENGKRLGHVDKGSFIINIDPETIVGKKNLVNMVRAIEKDPREAARRKAAQHIDSLYKPGEPRPDLSLAQEGLEALHFDKEIAPVGYRLREHLGKGLGIDSELAR